VFKGKHLQDFPILADFFFDLISMLERETKSMTSLKILNRRPESVSEALCMKKMAMIVLASWIDTTSFASTKWTNCAVVVLQAKAVAQVFWNSDVTGAHGPRYQLRPWSSPT